MVQFVITLMAAAFVLLDIVAIVVLMSVSQEAMDIYVLMSVAVRMAPVHLWMDHVIAQLVLLGNTVTSHVLVDQLDSIAPNIATAQFMAPVTNSQGHVSVNQDMVGNIVR